ncbi:hypothetical protein SARC_06818 [Sphaeroforma arctica JP610]|uniref:Uncharacterized protein n=1 Tax=Sphaeroforma arctica JP610 TaxID=667725 RepID=A0A0L0FW85_9EUKA|nr:hypothetical protein SARC_06818 [Sphaeroforma arctica JP610]KNC80836.1 hypothetical protein SARC_06818 [Sphaeroforma arctica JP610]|eukprot:XP_014154738.1 hypothetical protein SARC_06818 [Sphaeroforma arctica JP610]
MLCSSSLRSCEGLETNTVFEYRAKDYEQTGPTIKEAHIVLDLRCAGGMDVVDHSSLVGKFVRIRSAEMSTPLELSSIGGATNGLRLAIALDKMSQNDGRRVGGAQRVGRNRKCQLKRLEGVSERLHRPHRGRGEMSQNDDRRVGGLSESREIGSASSSVSKVSVNVCTGHTVDVVNLLARGTEDVVGCFACDICATESQMPGGQINGSDV